MASISKPESCIRCPYKWKYLNLLKTDDINAIQQNCLIINFKKGETICKQGTDVTHALYLAKGMVKLYIEGGKKDLILKLIKAGSYIDLQTLFGDLIYRYSVAAVEDSMICMINSEFILELAKKNPGYLFELTKTISTSTNYVFKKISDISRKQLRGRLADTLLHFAGEIYGSNKFELNITRRELAQFSSMSMENAVRILSEYKKEGLISLKGRIIEILQPEILKKFSELG